MKESNSKTLIDVIMRKNRDTVMQAETSLSIADHHDVSCMINLRKQRMKPIQIYGRNYANYSAENVKISGIQLSNNVDLMYETDSVDSQAKTLTENFLIALDTCAPF